MLWNIWFTLSGPAKTHEVPNKGNPVEFPNIGSLLESLLHNLPTLGFGITIAGIRVELLSDQEKRNV